MSDHTPHLVHVRLATVADLEGIDCVRVRVRNELEQARGIHQFSEFDYVELTPRDDTTNDVLCLVSELEGLIVGIATAKIDGRRCFVHEHAVDPDFREIGIGTRLFDEITKWAHNSSCELIEIQVLVGERDTKNFYESHGAKARSLTVSKTL